MERVRQHVGEERALCTICQGETDHDLIVSGRPHWLGHEPVHDVRRYRVCRQCGSRQVMLDPAQGAAG